MKTSRPPNPYSRSLVFAVLFCFFSTHVVGSAYAMPIGNQVRYSRIEDEGTEGDPADAATEGEGLPDLEAGEQSRLLEEGRLSSVADLPDLEPTDFERKLTTLYTMLGIPDWENQIRQIRPIEEKLRTWTTAEQTSVRDTVAVLTEIEAYSRLRTEASRACLSASPDFKIFGKVAKELANNLARQEKIRSTPVQDNRSSSRANREVSESGFCVGNVCLVLYGIGWLCTGLGWASWKATPEIYVLPREAGSIDPYWICPKQVYEPNLPAGLAPHAFLHDCGPGIVEPNHCVKAAAGIDYCQCDDSIFSVRYNQINTYAAPVIGTLEKPGKSVPLCKVGKYDSICHSGECELKSKELPYLSSQFLLKHKYDYAKQSTSPPVEEPLDYRFEYLVRAIGGIQLALGTLGCAVGMASGVAYSKAIQTLEELQQEQDAKLAKLSDEEKMIRQQGEKTFKARLEKTGIPFQAIVSALLIRLVEAK